MAHILILHGTMGHDRENWFPWLKDVLEQEGHSVHIPLLPTPEGQTPENWFAALDAQVPDLSAMDVIIGHSCGGTFLLHILQERAVQPQQTFFVGAPIDEIKPEPFGKYTKTFVAAPFDWARIASRMGQALVVHGDDDPHVALSQGEKLAQSLDAPLEIVSGGGHLNEAAGYTAFPALLPFLKI